MSATRHRFLVKNEDAGLRLDQVLAARVPEFSRRKARALIDLGGVFVDGARVKVAGRVLKVGQEVVANVGSAFERATKETGKAARTKDEAHLPEFRIVYTDTDVCVVDKPAGLLTAPTPESDRGNLARMLAEHLGGAVFVVHRLDLGTSGLLVFARNQETNRALAEVFRAHNVERVYWAVLLGSPAWEEKTVTADVGGKSAETTFKVLEMVGTKATLAMCTLKTGRTHQIRLHAAAVGFPVMGDKEHGTASALDPPRMALHATVLGFVHPRTRQALRFESAWPDELGRWAEGLRSDKALGERP
ncbi:MAG: RluA family pseudouridine synthase [Polyangiaceae bacterium]|nr:RluA family pseudouridine synthase [Polyangiaceae bacterium]